MMGCLELKQTLQRVEVKLVPQMQWFQGRQMLFPGQNEDTARSGQMLQSKVAGSGQESVPETTDGASAQTTAAFAEPANSTPSYKVYIVGEGETLYGICFKEYNNIRKLEEICRINFPDR